MAKKQLPERPWTIPLTVAEIPDGGGHHDLSADAAVRDGVAELAGLRTLSRLDASFDLNRRGEGVAVRGEVRAHVGQTCVVTLEPIESDIHETVDLLFMPAEKTEEPATAKRKSEPPEPLENGVIDLGAITVEFLVLGLDPYPRKPGVAFSRLEGEEERARPFAALVALKKNT